MTPRTAILLLWLGMMPSTRAAEIIPFDANAGSPRVIISEFMADNKTTLADEDGDFTDWIEIYNPGVSAVNLDGWYLTDTVANLVKWRFPPTFLEPKSYLVVFASGKDRLPNPGRQFHTNFKLKAVGGYLALTDPNGLTIATEFQPAYPPQTPDISYGLDRLDPALRGYFVTPTPGAQNATSGTGFAPSPAFSHESGVFANASLSLVITVPTGTTVRYTTDGSLPINSSTAYTAPITLQNNTTIKVRAFPSAEGLFPSPVQVRNFLFLDASTQDFNSNLPVLVLSTEGRGMSQGVAPGFPRTKGTFVVFDNLLGRSALSSKPDYIGPAEFEVFGQTAAGFPKHPYNIELQDASGNDKSVPILGLPAEDDWKLRNPFSDKCLMNDFLAYELFEQMGNYSCRRRFVEVFVDTGGARLSYPGDYIGVEVLLEKIERGKDRVDIAKLDPGDTNEPAITGGWIFKKDKDSNGDINIAAGGTSLKVHEPKPQTLRTIPSSGGPTSFPGPNYTASASNQLGYLIRYLDAFNVSMNAADWLTATGTNHYSYYIDVDTFVDQHWIVEFPKQISGYRLSNFFSKDRNGKIKNGPIWDWDLAFGNANYLDGGHTNGWYYPQLGAGDHLWLRRLVGAAALPASGGDPDFIQKVIDRWGSLRTNIMNGDRLIARIDELANLLNEASARNFSKYAYINAYQWPNPDGAFNGDLAPTRAWDVDYLQPTYAGIISEMKKWTMGRYLWIDSQFPKPPTLTFPEGNLVDGSPLDIFAPAGTIYYTLDGTDPRASQANGAVSPTALTYSGTVLLNHNARVFARARVGTTWSAPAIATYVGQRPRLVITEIMYHPMASGTDSGYTNEQFQFIELKNTGTIPIGMGGIRLTNGIDFTFPSTDLPPGQYLLVVKNRAAFAQRYGPGRPIAGEFQGSLAFSGERLALVDVIGQSIVDFEYRDRWHGMTDGAGLSLVASDEHAAASEFLLRRGWKPSRLIHGSPGQPEPASIPVVPVVINELLSNPLPPLEDAVELFNPTSDEADISFWYLTDDLDQPRKFQIPPATFAPPFGFVSFDEHNFNPFGNLQSPTSFSFNANGDGVYLYSADEAGNLTGYVHGFRFVAARTNETFGRYIAADGAELFVPQFRATFGEPNSGPIAPPVGLRPTLALTELMFDPGPLPPGNTNAAADLEFIEIKNVGPDPIDLGGAEFVAGVSFTFPVVILAPGQYVLVVRNGAAFASRYGTNRPVIGEFSGGLAAEGERLALVGATAEPILDFTYDSAPFPLTRGFGLSLVLADEQSPRETYSSPASWRTGSIEGGSPGEAEPRVSDPILITEVLTHTVLPNIDQIELFNPIGAAVNVGGWWLTDEFDTPKKFRIPADTVISAGGYRLFNEPSFNGSSNGFSLSSKGGEIYLFSGDGTNLTGYFQGYSFGAAASGVSFGRYVDSQTNVHFVAQSTQTLGTANAGPSIGPIVISEVNYHPPDLGTPIEPRSNTPDEYIELQNTTGANVPLFDVEFVTNTWRLRGGIDYQFPMGTVLSGGTYLLVVNFDPANASQAAAFRSRMGVPASVPLYGPFSDDLGNEGDNVELARPDVPPPPSALDAGTVAYILVDKVNYKHTAPWPEGAHGLGPSLQRVSASAFGNDPASWASAGRTPGGGYVNGASPSIAQHPQSATVVARSSAMFSVTATGPGPLSYQWRFNGSPISVNLLPTATSATLILHNVQPNQAGIYSCIVLNLSGVAFSSNATLTVLVPSTILQQPTNVLVRVKPDPAAASTTNAYFSAAATTMNRPLFYQWRFNGTNLAGATNLTGINTPSLVISNVTIADGGDYSCAISDAISTISTINATLSPLVTPIIVPGFISHVAVTGAPVTLSVAMPVGNPLPYTVEWRRGSTVLATNIVYQPADFMSVIAPSPPTANQLYRVLVRNLATTGQGIVATNLITSYRDSDGDGVPDPFDANPGVNDATVDSDGDGMSNHAEYIAGTNPTNAASYLKVDRLTATGAVRIEFLAVSNRTYAVEAAAGLPAAPWKRVAEVAAAATNRLVEVLDPMPTSANTQRVYRLVTPRAP